MKARIVARFAAVYRKLATIAGIAGFGAVLAARR